METVIKVVKRSKIINNSNIKFMSKGNYKLEDVKIGNHVTFSRAGVKDFGMYWTVLGFEKGMIQVKIAEMGFNDKIYINPSDILILLDINDTRYIDEK